MRKDGGIVIRLEDYRQGCERVCAQRRELSDLNSSLFLRSSSLPSLAGYAQVDESPRRGSERDRQWYPLTFFSSFTYFLFFPLFTFHPSRHPIPYHFLTILVVLIVSQHESHKEVRWPKSKQVPRFSRPVSRFAAVSQVC
jgi:hypothetical protein